MPARTLGLAAISVATLALLAWVLAQWRLPGNDAGYTPVQPIAFSHRLHSTDLQINCLYCHAGADTARYAGMPAANVCMNCHRFVAAPTQAVKDEQWRAAREGRDVRRIVSDAMRTLYRAQGLDDALRPDPNVSPQPIAWVRVTQFPDFAYFDHGAHSRAASSASAVTVRCRRSNGRGRIRVFRWVRASPVIGKAIARA